MVAKTLYFKNVTVNGALSLQDGGTAPVGAITATGWTAGQIAAGNFSLMAVGSKHASTAFSTTDALVTPAFTAGSCWRSEQPYNGSFASANWSLAFRVRAGSAPNAQGRVRCRIWKSANADGSGAVQLTSAILVGSTTAALSTGASGASTVTWTPGAALAFNNEYLFVQCEWEITTAGGNQNSDALFYVESAGAITTSDFVARLNPSLYNDIAEAFLAPSPIILINGVAPPLHYDSDGVAIAAVLAGSVNLIAVLHGDSDLVAGPVTASEILSDALYGDTDGFAAPSIGTLNVLFASGVGEGDGVLAPAVGSQVTIGPLLFVDIDDCLGPDEIASLALKPSLFSDTDYFMVATIVGGQQKHRLVGSIGSPGYMVGNMAGLHRSMSGSTHVEYGQVA